MNERTYYIPTPYQRPVGIGRKRSFRARYKPPLAKRAKEHCRKFTAFMFSNVGIILLVILYTIAGAFMFIAIEGGEAMERSAERERERELLTERLWNISCCKTNIFNETAYKNEVDREIFNHQQKIVKLAIKGGGDSGHWHFPGAFLYSLTVITTIGYGNISPRTNWGKISTILYAIIGMPLFLLYLSNIGDILAKSFKWTYAKVCLCRICPGVAIRRAIRERRKIREAIKDIESFHRHSLYENDSDHESPESLEEEEEEEDDTDIEAEIQGDTQTVIVPLTTCIAIMIGYMLFGAILFERWEGWEILDGSYFCFISLSSIGFGDIVPGNELLKSENHVVEVSFILCAVYLLLGMALIAMCFNLMQEQVIHKLRNLKHILRHCFRCACKKDEENIEPT